jgi:hypothetical protein
VKEKKVSKTVSKILTFMTVCGTDIDDTGVRSNLREGYGSIFQTIEIKSHSV